MSERKNLCVLVALHPVDAVLAERLGTDEARHAAERHARRIERAVVMQGGQVLIADAEQTVAAFERSDAAVHAASEALERIHALPPLLGSKQTVRIGVHYGALEGSAEEPVGDGPAVARQLAHLAESGQALISGTAVMLEMARVLREKPPPRDVIFAFFDAEAAEGGVFELQSTVGTAAVVEGEHDIAFVSHIDIPSAGAVQPTTGDELCVRAAVYVDDDRILFVRVEICGFGEAVV